MPPRPARSPSLDKGWALFRWFFIVVTFLLARALATGDAISMQFYAVAGLALLYNLVLTALALLGISWVWLPWASGALDVLIVAALVSSSGRTHSPILSFPLVPAIMASIRLGWLGGLGASAIVAAFWIYVASDSLFSLSAATLTEMAPDLAMLASATVGVVLLSIVMQARAREREMEAEEQARLAGEQVQAICELTGNLSATLDYERVLDSILDVGILGLQELGAGQQAHVCAVLLFDSGSEERQLQIAACRHLTEKDRRQTLAGRAGMLAEVLDTVEPRISGRPGRDPELKALEALRDCRSVVAIPLRAGFDLFGVLMFANKRSDAYGEQQMAFLGTLCSQAAIALQNAQFYERLQAEKDRIISEESEVRHWLARALHDGPTQTISAVAMRLNYLRFLMEREPAKVDAELSDLEQMARRATREIRTTLFKLRPLALESQGFRGALEQYAKRLEEESGPRLQIDVEEPAERFDPKVESAMFAIVEEAVNNARKYSKADSISVRMAPYEGVYVATVRDAGVGFDLKAVESNYDERGSLGLLNMRERADLLGGKLEIETRPGFGTIVTLVVPLRGKS